MKNALPVLLVFISAAVAGQVNPDFTYTQTCFGNQTTLVATSSLADNAISAWEWDLDGNGTYDKTGKTVISLIIVNDTVAVKLRIVPNTGSADSISKNVIIDPLPQVNFMVNNLCESNPATYTSLSTITPGSIAQWKWDFDNNGVDDATGATVNYTCGPPATYVTKLTCVSDKGCSAFTQKTTTIYANPVASFTSPGACEQSSAAFTNTSSVVNPDFFVWNFGDGSQSATSGNATHTYSTWGTYSVQLVAVSMAGCRDTVIQAVTINGLPVISVSGNNPVCEGGSIVLTASGGVSYAWSTGATDGSITVSPTASSTYSVTGTAANGCSAAASAAVTVNPLPLVSVTGNTTLAAGGSTMLIANGANSYSWSTGETTNNIIVTQGGTYSVKGTDMNGCMAADSLVVTTDNPELVSISGLILTPNDDNINDALVINSISIYDNCDLNVYNMWNDEVFSTKGYKNDWKGTGTGGAPLPAGSYYYIVKCDDKELLKGNINILR